MNILSDYSYLDKHREDKIQWHRFHHLKVCWFRKAFFVFVVLKVPNVFSVCKKLQFFVISIAFYLPKRQGQQKRRGCWNIQQMAVK